MKLQNKTNSSKEWTIYQIKYRESYAEKSGDNDPTYHFVKYLVDKKIIKNSNLLEIGFGDAKSLMLYSNLFIWVTGADISYENIEFTENEFKKLKIKNSDFFVLDLIDDFKIRKTYDNVLLSHVFEHFREDELKIVIKNISRLLNKGGNLIGATPYDQQFQFRVCPNCSHEFEIDGHQTQFNETTIKKFLNEFGFKEIINRHFNLQFYLRNKKGINKILRKYYILTRRLSNDFRSRSINQLEFCFKKVM